MRKAHRIVQFSSRLLNEYVMIRKNELGIRWEYLRKRRETKLRWICNGSCGKTVIPETYEGVGIGDKILIEKYGDPIKEPAVYGGIEINNDIRNFLSQIIVGRSTQPCTALFLYNLIDKHFD